METGTRIGFRDRPTLWLAAILMFLTGALYIRVLSCEFVDVDDTAYVTDNPHVRSGVSGENFSWAFGKDNVAGLWIPVAWISLQVDATLSEQPRAAAAPRGTVLLGAPEPLPPATIYHVDNVFLQMLATVALFLFLYRATRARWAAFAVAALWTIHPLRVESVAWVTERKDVLAGLFGFLSMYVYVAWVRRGGWQRYAMTCLFFVMSVAAKPMFVTLPFLLVVIDGWPLGRVRSVLDVARRLAEKWALLILAAAVAVLTAYGQRQIGAVVQFAEHGLGERLAHAAVAYVTYIMRHVQVWDLSVFYPYGNPPGVIQTVTCAALLAGITGICVQQMRRRLWLLAGWLWYLGTMLPMIGIMQSGEQAYADRFTYLPSVGLWIMISFTAWDWLFGRKAAEAVGPWPLPKKAVMAAAGTYAVVMMGFTWRQVGYWQDMFTLGDRALAVTKDNWFMHRLLGIAYEREGKNEKSEEHYAKAVELEPRLHEHWYSLGFLHLRLGQADNAARELAKAAKLKPMDMKSHFFHGVALEQTGHRDGAIMEYYNALMLEPGNQRVASELEKAAQDRTALEAAIRRIPDLERYRPR